MLNIIFTNVDRTQIGHRTIISKWLDLFMLFYCVHISIYDLKHKVAIYKQRKNGKHANKNHINLPKFAVVKSSHNDNVHVEKDFRYSLHLNRQNVWCSISPHADWQPDFRKQWYLHTLISDLRGGYLSVQFINHFF